MQASRIGNQLVLEFGMLEKQVLLHIFRSVIGNYRQKPEELDPKASATLYSTRGCKSAGMTPEETREWVHSLHEFKSANLALLEKWVNAMAQKPAESFTLKLPVEQAQALLSILNDHRLLAAAQSEIGDDEMEMHSLTEFEGLPADKQAALYEIHFLAWLMEEILRLAAPEAANWNASPDEP
jgi:hypothetical protein